MMGSTAVWIRAKTGGEGGGGSCHKITCNLQCCGSNYIEFGSGSRVMLSILKEKLKIILEKNNFLF